MAPSLKNALDPRLWLGGALIAFQYWILQNPQTPMFERPVHLILALALVFLWLPLEVERLPPLVRRAIDALLVIGVVAVGWYYWSEMPRLTTRIDNVSPVFGIDVFFGILFVVLILEAVRRCVGWILLAVLLAFLAYGAFGYVLPGALGFRGFGLTEYVEILTMTTSGILGVTTETSVNFIFYFITFGVVYAAVGGGQLFIDLAMRTVGTARGGAAKVAIVGSSLMGTISGSAVANVASTGVFTIPLMKGSGVPAERAGATEAIASTGGQLMPPIMGVAAFVMAELLVVPYAQIALAGLIPAIAFYFALFISADLYSRRHGVGTLSREELGSLPAILPRAHLLAPPLVLIAGLMLGYSAQRAATFATIACLLVTFVKREDWLTFSGALDIVRNVGRQVAEIAVPIGAIGIVVAVAIQTGMALKFSSGLISVGGGSLVGSLILVILGCIVMGMGLPTVAAYIIGAILYVPALQNLGVPPLAAHFFVFYYCVLSMVTPPVSLASFAGAAIARTGAMTTSIVAFKMSFVAFLIPFAFIADDALLFQDGLPQVLLASVGLFVSTSIWAVGLVGYLVRPLGHGDRALLLLCGLVAIVSPTGDLLWWAAIGIAILFLALNWRFPWVTLLPAAPSAGKGSRHEREVL